VSLPIIQNLLVLTCIHNFWALLRRTSWAFNGDVTGLDWHLDVFWDIQRLFRVNVPHLCDGVERLLRSWCVSESCDFVWHEFDECGRLFGSNHFPVPRVSTLPLKQILASNNEHWNRRKFLVLHCHVVHFNLI
jgi:hypothetical protein